MQELRAPILEELEPRLLLNADLSGSTSLLSLPTSSDGSALMVDLGQQEDGAPQAATPLISYETTDSGTVADEPSQVGESLGAPLDPDPVKSPVTHTQMYAGVDVQPSTATAPATPDFPVLGLPASYDLRTYGYVMPVENQGAIGSCWAFATYGSLESSVLKDGGGANDLSENHLKNYHGFDWDPTEGGNYYISEAYLSRWDGPVREADDPYHDYDDRPSPGGPPQYYVREVLEFDTDSEIKDGLMTYGAIGTVMYMNTSYYNATTHTYYYTGTANANHAVTIVGWDDNKAVPGAPGAGAWLIQNSWGAEWGEGGYFWLSYYDRQGGNDGFSFHDAVPASTYQKVYYYDDFGSVGSWNISYAFNAFTASSDQDLTAVQFWTMADGASYEIEVYDTFSGGSLTGWLGSTYGTSEYAGMHTVNLPAPIHLTAGNDFYVYLHITDGGTYPMSADWRVSGYSSTCIAGTGQSYYSADGNTWKDLGTLDWTANFSIRALVTTTMPPEITVSGNGAVINDGDITPTWVDGTDFGSAPLGGAGISRTFLVRNDGTGTLKLGSVTVPTGFTLTDGLPANLAPGASDTFTVRLDTAIGGTKSGYVFIQNDDRDEHPYNFAITGLVPAPEVTVLGNGISIPDGKAGPEWDTGTDFGSVFQGGTPVVRTFTVRNDGAALLTLGPVSIPTGFTLLDGLSSSLTPGTSDTFTIQLDTATSGYKYGDVSFANNDSDENPFNFGIDGNVSALTGPGDLDVTFMDGGKVITAVGPQSYGRAVAIQPDGKIVVAGFISNSGNYDFAVARYRPDGWLDTSFDGDGKVTTALGAASETGRDVAIQPDGKIVVVGYSNTGSNDDFAVVRYNANGSLDASFGSGGVVTTAIGSGDDWGRSVAIQPDGKIVVAGRSAVGGNYAFSLVRYNADGSLDSSFDGDGKVITSVGSSSQGYNIAVQSDGKIVVVGESGGNFAVVRYNADGSWDASFGAGGIVTTDLGSSTDIGYGVALQSDGKIVASGESNSAFAVVRYNANGSLDTSFDGDGRVTTALGISGKGYSVAIQPTGKIVVAGASGVFALARYNPDGSLDTSFSEDGKVIQPFGESYAMALQSDGKIVVAGGSNYFVVARFLGDGLPSGEITVLGNGISIADGDATPGAADGTYFGSAPQGGTAISRTFTVRNDGRTALTLGAVTVPTDFALTEGLSSSLAPGASDTFTVQLDTDVVAPKAGEVSFATNDPDENPFNFRIAGTVGNLSLNQPAVASTSYAGLPAANATDGDLGSRWSSEFSDNEWIYVDLGSIYAIDRVVLRWESAYGRGYKLQVSGDASAWADIYSATTGDGGVDDISLSSPVSGRYVRMLGTQRATAYGYSLYEFEVYGRVPGPEVTVLGNGISIANADGVPSVADGTDFGSVSEGAAAVSRMFTVRNDGDVTLTLGAVTVPAGFTLTEGLSGSLEDGASDTFTVQLDSATVGTYSGEISFATNDANENPFHFAITGTVSPPTVTVAVAPAEVMEDGSANLVYTFTRSAADGSPLTVNFSVGGTAVFGTDYTQMGAASFSATSGTVIIAADQTTAIVTIDPTVDTTPEPDETVILTVTAGTGYTAGTPAVSAGTIQNDDGNLALGKTATASTSYGGLLASNATDGNASSRWSSSFSDDEWIYVDLGPVYAINRVVLQWEAAYGRGYKLQVSSDASSWADVYSTTTGDGGVDDIALAAPAIGRYVRMLGTQRATAYGYSLYEFEVYGGAAGPEVTVLGNGAVIVNGDATPSAGDGTDFGSVAQGEVAVSHTFTVRNDGSDSLTLGPVTVPAGYTLAEELATSLAPGASDTFTVQLDSATAGVKSGAISFPTDDSDENPFYFTVTGTVLAPPEITVLVNGIVIADGDTTPDTADNTDFGSVPQGAAGISRTFTVRNDGDSPLTLGAVTMPAGFTLTEGLSTSLAAGASDTFTVRLDTAAVGAKTGEIFFATNDSDENPFNFTIAGTVLPAPEITVQGNGISITDGDATPGPADGTNFGSVLAGGAAVSRTFTVRNDGTAALMLGAVEVPAGYTVTEGLSVSLEAGESDTFTVQLDAVTPGTRTGDISFVTNDPDENPFNFRITGTVLGPGDLDPTFGSGGIVATDVEGAGRALAVAIQSDGRIVAAGYTNAAGYRFVVVRYNADGSLDTSFDGDGMLTTGFGTSEGVGHDVAVQPDGKIVVAGYAYSGSSNDFAVVRYNADGSLDASFGVGGRVITDFGSTGDHGYSLALQRDGKIVVAGGTGVSGAYSFALARYNPDGSLDSSFDGDGRVTTAIGSSSVGYGVALQPDGKIVVVGESGTGNYGFAVARYNPDGSLDTSFDGDGWVTTAVDSPSRGRRVALQPDGKIVVAGETGSSSYNFALVRYNSDGSLDPSFDGDGQVTTAVGASSRSYGVALQSDGKIVVAGSSDGDFAVVRYNGNGSLDASFGADGKALASQGYDAAYGVAIQSDGKIVVAGEIGYIHAAARFIGGPSAAETTVLGDGVWIADGDTTPSTADGTDFGSVTQGAAALSRVFTVRNDGALTLVLGAVTVPPGFTLTEELSTGLAPGASDTFTVQLDTATIGTKSGEISFSTNDPDENPFNFTISGTVQAPAPEIAVLGNSIVIADGDATPSTTDGTDFGSVLQDAAAVSRTFTVRNEGSAVLTLGAVTVPAGFTLTEGLSSSLAAGVSDTFIVQLDTATVGTYTGEISFATNDSDENPFHFTITGTVTAPIVPEVTVTIAPSGVVEDGLANLVYTFTRSVADSSPLTVSFSVGGTATFAIDYTQSGAAGFNATAGTIVIGANQTTATVTVDPAADAEIEPDETVILTVTAGTGYTVGTPAASTGTIQNDDAAGNLALGRTATASTSYAGLPPANTTDGDASSRWSSQFSDNEWIYVDLGSAYTISRVVLSWEAAYGRGYKLQVSSNASTWSDVYTTTAGDGGVDDLTLAAPASGRYVRMLGTQRGTMYGYSLWEFEVYGGTPTNHAPAVSSFSKSLTQDTPLVFAAADFAGAFTDPDAGNSLQKIKIASLPTHGVLALNGTAVTLNQEIATAQIGTLIYTPNGGYTGLDSFQWNGSDGSLYAATDAAVNLSISAAAANLALGKTAAASTSYSGYPASNVTDGNTNSRWSSEFSHNEWISVDLGSVYAINRVVLNWQTAYGRSYKIQVSGNGSTWSDVYTTTTGDGGVDDITLSSPASGRYVRMLGLQRATEWGYSLYEFEVYGGAAGPEVTVLGHGVSIADGDTTPSATDGTSFGSVVQGTPAISRTFTVRNEGGATLTLGTVTVPAGFTLTEGLSGSLAPGASDTFTVQLETATVGTKSGAISFATNDSDENPFHFQITGVVTLPGEPEVTVTVSPSAVAEDGSTNLVYTFTRSVADSSPLTVSFSVGGTATFGDDYTQTGAASFDATSGTVVIAAGQTTATVTVDPTADPTVEPDETVILTVTAGAGYTVGTPAGSTGTIQNDDGSANLALGKTAVASTSYAGLPASHATDGNLSSRWSSAFSDQEWIYVDLGAVYTINRVVLRWETAYGRGYKIQVSNDAGSWSDAYTTTAGDGGMDDLSLSSPALGRYVRMLGTQRGTAYGYSLYELEVYAQAVAPNLALGKTAVASTSYTGLPASHATDGNTASRWSSAFSDQEWIYVDLGAVYTIHQVVLRWETAYGRGYTIQISNDASTWSDVYSTATGDGGVDDITLASPVSGRYVRLLGTQRATIYGYSLWEFEIYG
jgi:uncharacterized delta-60 repeat protein